MKYGKIIHNYGEGALKTDYYNIGDSTQTIGLEYIYREMGIPDEQIVGVDLCDLKSYDGEYVLLPMYSMALGIGFSTFPLSDRIIPLFISSHIAKTELEAYEVDYLSRWAPIGCRDEFSLNTMRKYNINSYMSGCLTALMPRRNKEPLFEKCFFVDVPESLIKYIPADIMNNAEFISHMYPIKKAIMTTEDGLNNYNISQQYLQRYYDEATLVVSSKQHALIPCMAAGIPVIAAPENISYRFSWLDKYLKVYSERDFYDINWDPEPVSYEDEKKEILDLFCEKIAEAYSKNEKMYAVSEFYENREKSRYGSYYFDVVSKMPFEEAEEFDYIIWGCGLAGNSTYEIMKQRYPNSHLVAAIDSYLEGVWHGVKIIKPKQIGGYGNVFILIATYSGKNDGYATMSRLEKTEGKDFLYCGSQNG